jgi:HEPN domain-containing protein
LDVCLSVEREFENLQEVAKTLTPYATEFRYPAEVMEPEPQEAEQAFEMAKSTFHLVVSLLNALLDEER